MSHAWAQTVAPEQAARVAANFLNNSGARQHVNLELAHVEKLPGKKPAGNIRTQENFQDALIYIFNINQTEGLILVSGDARATPVLGYSLNGSYNATQQPEAFRKWIEFYRKQIIWAKDNLPETEALSGEWKALDAGTAKARTGETKAVGPLLQTIWNQAPYYNDLCPYDPETDSKSVTGCVATAMAQIMKYWNYPAQGSGFSSYQHDRFGTLSANYGTTTYQWSSMPNNVTSSNTAVATLMYHCGVSVEMDYSGESSGAYGSVMVAPALKNYFLYAETAAVAEREDYSNAEWLNLLRSELDAGQPVYYEGFGGGSGHAFVCDGYDQGDFFHFNWGWGGYSDGYFKVDALDPEGLGIGAGDGVYNSYQTIVYGIKPREGADSEEGGNQEEVVFYNGLGISEDLTISSENISYGESFSVHCNLVNGDKVAFNGDLGAAVFDSQLNFVNFVEVIENVSLNSGYTFTDGLTFSSEGSLEFLPGTYSVYVFYKPASADWILLNGTGDNISTSATFTVSYQDDIEVYSEMTVEDADKIYSGGSLSVSFSVANTGSSDFSGILDLSLYSLDGNYVADVEVLEGIELCSGCYFEEPLSFSTSSLAAAPGTYLMALQYVVDGTEDYQLAGSSYHTNPIKVIVQSAPLHADSYENNDQQSAASLIDAAFANDQFSYKTASNFHTNSDYDYYKIELEAGFAYTISARLQDSYASDDNQAYTVDALFSYSIDDGEFEGPFDDIIGGDIEVEGPATVVFFAAPYFQGLTGTYSLDLNLSREEGEVATGIGDEKEAVSIYPNPVSGSLHVSALRPLAWCNIYSVAGKQVWSSSAAPVLDLSSLSAGVYILELIAQSGEIQKHRIIKE